MPGTWGSLLAIPLVVWANQNLSELPRVGFWILVTLAGSWAAAQFQRLFGVADNQNIVIDEVIGMGIAGWISSGSLQSLVAVFVLFRIFDIVKVPPVRAIDRWSKAASSPFIQGFGVMADDIGAGFQALGVYALLVHFDWISGL
jgi:phosphatidylglycerophosphatase A